MIPNNKRMFGHSNPWGCCCKCKTKLIRCWESTRVSLTDLLSSLGHLVSIPAWTVWVRLLHLRVELPAAAEVVDGLKGQSGLVSWEIQRQVHYSENRAERKCFRHRSNIRSMPNTIENQFFWLFYSLSSQISYFWYVSGMNEVKNCFISQNMAVWLTWQTTNHRPFPAVHLQTHDIILFTNHYIHASYKTLTTLQSSGYIMHRKKKLIVSDTCKCWEPIRLQQSPFWRLCPEKYTKTEG